MPSRTAYSAGLLPVSATQAHAPTYAPITLLCLLLLLRISTISGVLLGASVGHKPQGTAGHLSWAQGRQTRSYGHLEGETRLRRLYSATRFFLSIDTKGRVSGTRKNNHTDCLMEIRSVSTGVVVIRSVSTGLYLAMSKRGDLYGSVAYTAAECQFRERIEENGYNTYAARQWSLKGRPMFVSLGTRGKPRSGRKARRRHRSTHFLPMPPI
ncbi:fibroblast growth factor 22-like [Brienomyrus brachyistius]|uniref:fibroblast growth factor 22-like n=1 Tax=Brienomyrus brachyistius TaxID=42636 RepID=UPI0020B214DB|nr:fibroblast growth factor 22-like [Brienomyrus brachyistius]